MMRQRARLLGLCCLGLFTAAGCSRSSRQTLTEHGVSIIKLDGWERTSQRGSAVFKDPDSKTTIAIRSVPFEGRETGKRDPDSVIAATQTVLERLPKARVHESYQPKLERFRARTFELTYTPPGKRTEYDRRHTVILGSARIYHLWLTAPAGNLQARSEVFNKVVSSLREEL